MTAKEAGEGPEIKILTGPASGTISEKLLWPRVVSSKALKLWRRELDLAHPNPLARPGALRQTPPSVKVERLRVLPRES
ncbi:hypothetical protein DSO57_1030288 [Entomophthora muscae]|uniref:Uncharacterized protein n=1 Tax=Entomophthora muscae TaxID=34485 RepID=A0ACC2T124_9FUNG|nr:hypothetical protein DSO57_1030288 [Entomophthora muscae]